MPRGIYERSRRPVAERFWTYVQKSDGCWLWTGSVAKAGYGQLNDGQPNRHRPVPAHRLSWELHFGPIPPGLVVMHMCDVKPCVRPDHLRLGTHGDNVQDKVNKKRHLWGSRLPMAKLREDDIPQIRALIARGESPTLIGQRFGVSAGAVHHIRKRETWAHVPEAVA